MTEAPTLEKIYVLSIRDKLDSLERLMIPTEQVTLEESEEIRALRDEAERGEMVPWSRGKVKARKLLD